MNDIEKGLVDCESLKQYNHRIQQFYEYVSLDNDTKSFVKYLKKCQKDIIRYRFIKEAVRACKL